MKRENIVHFSGEAELIGFNDIDGTKQANTDLCIQDCRNDLDIVHLNDYGIIRHSSIPYATITGKTLTPATSIRSANWHVTMNCNYNCRFCFYKNMIGEFKDIEKTRHILETLKNKGIEKINFAGGEPLLYKNLMYLLKMAKDMEFTVSVVTNASLLNENNIRELSSYVDWIGISVDSTDENIEKELGRGNGCHVEHVQRVCELIRKYGMKLKINTTVTKLNYLEDMKTFISSLRPDRWKVFQILYMKGQNDDALDLILTTEEFEAFRRINGGLVLNNGATPTFESADDMLNSYLIIGADGNILLSNDNQRSSVAFEELECMELTELVDVDKCLERERSYEWN
ncbi:viperin family antiviral radical SAM protein [Methanolobus vulcani]|nr:viperin family antiviral radical SAM protein [Methanolobus vulcani]